MPLSSYSSVTACCFFCTVCYSFNSLRWKIIWRLYSAYFWLFIAAYLLRHFPGFVFSFSCLPYSFSAAGTTGMNVRWSEWFRNERFKADLLLKYLKYFLPEWYFPFADSAVYFQSAIIFCKSPFGSRSPFSLFTYSCCWAVFSDGNQLGRR